MTCRFIDLHCDVPNNYIPDRAYLVSGIRWAERPSFDFQTAHGPESPFMTDLPGLHTARAAASLFTVHVPMAYDGRPLHRALSLGARMVREIESSQGIAIVRDAAALTAVVERDETAVVLNIENGDVFSRDLDLVHALFQFGFRSCTLAWYGRNCICDAPHESTDVGLSWFGRQVVKEMAALGMLVDVSHMNRAGVLECLELAPGRVFASHSNCRALCPVQRNIDDELLVELAQAGGVLGITLVPRFLSDTGEAGIPDVIRHVAHAASVMGIDHVAIGTDFDGVDRKVVGLERVDRIGTLAEGLATAGFSPDEIEAVMWRNAYGFLTDNLPGGEGKRAQAHEHMDTNLRTQGEDG